MNRQEMDECRFLPQEIKSIQTAMKSPRVKDVAVFYKDYRTGRGIPKTRIEKDGGEEDLKILRANLKACNRRLAKKLSEAEKFIEKIENAEVRAIFRMYYITGMTQEQIGIELHCGQSRVSQIINAFWFTEETKARKNSNRK